MSWGGGQGEIKMSWGGGLDVYIYSIENYLKFNVMGRGRGVVENQMLWGGGWKTLPVLPHGHF